MVRRFFSLPFPHIRFFTAAGTLSSAIIVPLFEIKPMEKCGEHPLPPTHLEHFSTIGATKMSHFLTS
jgi:hypothetical protein